MGRDASPSRVCPEPARPTQRTSAGASVPPPRAGPPQDRRPGGRSPGRAGHRRPCPVRARDRRGGPVRLRVAAQRGRGELPRGDRRPAARRATCSRARTRCTSSSRPARPATLVAIYTLDRRQDGALDEARTLSSDSPEELATLERQSAAEDRWDAVAQTAIDARNARRGAPGDGRSAARDRAVEDFLAANRDYQRVPRRAPGRGARGRRARAR